MYHKTMMTENAKNALRRAKICARQALSAEQRTELSRRICGAIAASADFQNARTVLLYRAVRGEADLAPLAETAAALGKTVAWPVCVSGTQMLALCPRDGGWITGRFGIPEPDPSRAECIAPEEIDLVVCPCTAFDEALRRLGMGGGFYDRFLERFGGAVIAAAFEVQKAERVPAEAWDRTMDAVFTEKAVYGRKE